MAFQLLRPAAMTYAGVNPQFTRPTRGAKEQKDDGTHRHWYFGERGPARYAPHSHSRFASVWVAS